MRVKNYRRNSMSDSSAIFVALLIIIILPLVAGRWAFGWGYGFLTTEDSLEVILEERYDIEVNDIEKGHFKGFARNFNNCREDSSQWYVTTIDGTEFEVCTEERWFGFAEPRVSLFELD